MVTNDDIIKAIRSEPTVESVDVSGDGYHYELTVVGDIFLGLSTLKRQQWVYAKLKHWITSGELHALTLKTWTNAEWEKHSG
ncbi:MAG: BolA/IbaG family iron-sulfur metabolism protein [Gammaproteobacteria bacterium]|nr:BolA/IbaG family iron-sulfur metabolism protein [Gammaproteobacteria bacterium]